MHPQTSRLRERGPGVILFQNLGGSAKNRLYILNTSKIPRCGCIVFENKISPSVVYFYLTELSVFDTPPEVSLLDFLIFNPEMLHQKPWI